MVNNDRRENETYLFSSTKAIRVHGEKTRNKKTQQKSTLRLTWQKSRDAGIPVCESEDSGDKWTCDSPPDICS